jgi:hypothetical protein
MADELDEMEQDHTHEAGLGAGIEDGDLDQNRQMRLEKKGKYQAIGRNIIYPVKKLRDSFRYARKHPIRATGIFAAATALGSGLSVIGAKITGQAVNLENTLSMGVTTVANYPLSIGAVGLTAYTWKRATDGLAGANYVIGHKRVQGTGPLVGAGLTTLMTLFSGNIYGDNILKTYMSPILDPLNTGAYVFAAIPDKIVDTVWSAAEGTHLDTWVTSADTAACLDREATTGTAFNLPCRDAYFDGSNFTPFDGYLNEVGDHDGLAEPWNKVKRGLENIGVMTPANDDGAALDKFLQTYPQPNFG